MLKPRLSANRVILKALVGFELMLSPQQQLRLELSINPYALPFPPTPKKNLFL
jgi:hypothetical protein